ncbi:winged helix-turn-helix transcriptional regulator [Parasphingorhabdus sp.]|uniref:winged helix-turn-helix transcriptional regulator n=1 Tax=Parasphingorhabdus sp. TaxID=2709688 RepID=UPI003D2708E0
MTRKSLEHLNCGWAQAAEAIGDKWSIMIVRDAFIGVKTFSAFAEHLSISRNILTQRLEHLIKHGVLIKRPIGLGSTRQEYVLTEKGHALFPIIVALYQWSDQWVFGEGKEPYVLIDKEKRQPLPKFEVSSKDGRTLSMADVTVTAGQGANENNRKVTEAIAENERLSGD